MSEDRSFRAKPTELHPELKVPAGAEDLADTNSPWPLSYVDLEVRSGVARIKINRPEAMNALNPSLMEELGNRVDDAIKDPDAKVLLFEGAGKAFVAGADIRFFVDALDDGDLTRIYGFTEKGQKVFKEIANSKKPTIAFVDGLALGGGAELALACEKIIVGPRASFAFPETGIGIYPALGGTQRLSRKIGKPLAQYLVLTGHAISHSDACAIGLADGCLADANPAMLDEDEKAEMVIGIAAEKASASPELPAWAKAGRQLFTDPNIATLLSGELPALDDPESQEFGGRALKFLSYKAPVALSIASHLIDDGFAIPLNDGLNLELGHLLEVFRTSDAYEGLSSVGRRRPAFKGN